MLRIALAQDDFLVGDIQGRNKLAIETAARVFAIAEYSELIFDAEYDNVDNLHAEKASISLLVRSVAQAASQLCWYETARQLNLLSARISQRFTDLADNQSRVIRIQTMSSRSALSMAWDYHGDPTRACEILTNNPTLSGLLPQTVVLIK